MTRLAIVSSHPIQYNAPAFRAIAQEPGIDLHVFYEWTGPISSIDKEFGRAIEWDIPLLDGYDHSFVPNRSKQPGTHHFFGINNSEIVGEVARWKPDVLLIYGWAFASHVKLLTRFRRRLPIMFRGDSTLLDPASTLHRTARRRVLNWIFGNVSLALYAGRNNYEYFRWAGVPERSLRWAPHAVDNDRFRGSETERVAARRWRSSLGIRDDETVFLFSGKLSAIKDPQTLINAFRSTVARGAASGLHLIFAGDGELRSVVEAESQSCGRIHFIGFQNQSIMPTVYHMANALVLPSRTETWGLSVNEAMAAGCPAIVSDRVGCAPDLVLPGVTGLQFRFGDREDLADQLLVLSDRRIADRMGMEARKHISGWSIPIYARTVAASAKWLDS